jgi:predicted permease
MQVFSTIIPIFAIVILGCIARRKGFMPPEFLGPANRLVYYLAIPALIFRSVSKASFRTEFNPTVLLMTMLSAVLIYLGAWLIGCLPRRWQPGRVGAFIQCSGHGNLGYIGLPIAFYYIGESGLAKASILTGFLSILQNILSVLALQANSASAADSNGKLGSVAAQVVRNPVILSALAGVAASLIRLPIPLPILRFLDILGGLAPPMSLLLIGASLSITTMKKSFNSVIGAVFIKIGALPVVGLVLYSLAGLKTADYLPGLILLATPTATVTYVMAKEMHGDAEFAVAAISTSTICSIVTYLIWLTAVGKA